MFTYQHQYYLSADSKTCYLDGFHKATFSHYLHESALCMHRSISVDGGPAIFMRLFSVWPSSPAITLRVMHSYAIKAGVGGCNLSECAWIAMLLYCEMYHKDRVGNSINLPVNHT